MIKRNRTNKAALLSRVSLLGGLCALAAAAPGTADATSSTVGTVIELFTSQGCSSCPPANANLAKLADRADVLALSFGVTYWDKLGWPDTFGSPQYTARQWDYAHALGHDQVWTPQIVVNGQADLVGANLGEIEASIERTPKAVAGPDVTIDSSTVTVGAGDSAGQAADVWLVRYDPRLVDVPVRAGENTGKTLPHRDVVHQFSRLGSWSGAEVSFALPPLPDVHYRTAILVQRAGGGPVLTAAYNS